MGCLFTRCDADHKASLQPVAKGTATALHALPPAWGPMGDRGYHTSWGKLLAQHVRSSYIFRAVPSHAGHSPRSLPFVVSAPLGSSPGEIPVEVRACSFRSVCVGGMPPPMGSFSRQLCAGCSSFWLFYHTSIREAPPPLSHQMPHSAESSEPPEK